MSGDGLRRPLNAPDAPPPAYGTQPGTTTAVVTASRVIVFGPNQSGVFVYDPAPGLGNLIASITDSATDPYGNATLSGVTGYSQSGGVFYAASLGPSLGGASAFTIWTASSAAGPYTNQGGLAADSSGNMTVGAAANLTLNTVAGMLRATRDASAFAGYVPIVQVDISANTAGNDANPHDVTKAWSIPAGDAAAGTTYTIKGLLRVNTGQTTIETLTIGVDLNSGTRTALATLGTAFNGGALNTVYSIPFELVLIADEIGADNPGIYLQAVLADESANRLSTNSANLNGHTDGATFTKANANTIAVYAQWGGAGGSAQNAHTTSSRLYREGP